MRRSAPEPALAQGAKQFLAPALSPGENVVMDNLATHKVAGVAEAIRAAGASVLYLPPHSRDLNPIEHIFSQAEGAPAQDRRSHP